MVQDSRKPKLCELSVGGNGHDRDGGVPASETGAKHAQQPINKQLWGPGFQTLVSQKCLLQLFSTLELKLKATGT